MILTVEDIQTILQALRDKYGFGYSDEPGIGALQAKLSIMLEMAAEQHEPGNQPTLTQGENDERTQIHSGTVGSS